MPNDISSHSKEKKKNEVFINNNTISRLAYIPTTHT